MASYLIEVETGGRPVIGASVTIYDEDTGVAEGNEAAGFTSGMEATVYSDKDMTTTTTQPLTTDSNGEVQVYLPSLTQVAVKVSRSGYGTRWHRWQDVTGQDPL